MASQGQTVNEQSPKKPTCFICTDPIISPKKRKCQRAAIETLIIASKRRKDDKYLEFQGLNELSIHDSCRHTYTSEPRILEASQSAGKTKAERRQRSVDAQRFQFDLFCFFCGDDASDDFIAKQKRKLPSYSGIAFIKKDDKLKQIATEAKSRFGTDLEAAFRPVVDRLKDDPVIMTMKPRYHKYCYNSFFKPSKSSNVGRPKDHSVKAAVDFVVDIIRSATDECQFSLANLLDRFKSVKKPPSKYLKTQVQSLLGDSATIYSVEQDYIVCFNPIRDNILSKEWLKSKTLDKRSERLQIVEAATKIVLEDIRGTYYDTKTYPPPSEFLQKVEEQVPETLKTFLNIVIKSNKKGKKVEKKLTNKLTVMSHNIIASVRPRSFLSPMHLGLSLMMHKNYA
ncbi:hypothetical protein QAD02_007354 [Eretmocerus hayati]|uniref:Uncharacterized protein n=1 Tax=Eretmocerus hayati TaxID=131215 RepID=A0ACC2N3S6_9HYME|nr:hypothetical protein QAD02_007354 [Eretmocerus hayati]